MNHCWWACKILITCGLHFTYETTVLWSTNLFVKNWRQILGIIFVRFRRGVGEVPARSRRKSIRKKMAIQPWHKSKYGHPPASHGASKSQNRPHSKFNSFNGARSLKRKKHRISPRFYLSLLNNVIVEDILTVWLSKVEFYFTHSFEVNILLSCRETNPGYFPLFR